MIDRLTVDKILDAANIVDVVSDFVTLKRAGVNLKGLCPFHDDIIGITCLIAVAVDLRRKQR